MQAYLFISPFCRATYPIVHELRAEIQATKLSYVSNSPFCVSEALAEIRLVIRGDAKPMRSKVILWRDPLPNPTSEAIPGKAGFGTHGFLRNILLNQHEQILYVLQVSDTLGKIYKAYNEFFS